LRRRYNWQAELHPEVSQNQRRLLVLGQIMDGMIEKSRNYDLPLPPDIECVRDELERNQALSATPLNPRVR
jgi:hypothetical protein